MRAGSAGALGVLSGVDVRQRPCPVRCVTPRGKDWGVTTRVGTACGTGVRRAMHMRLSPQGKAPSLGRARTSAENYFAFDVIVDDESVELKRGSDRQSRGVGKSSLGQATLHGVLDLALRRHAELLEEFPNRQVESLFVHDAFRESGKKDRS